MADKSEIDIDVAFELGMPSCDVRDVTDEFLRLAAKYLAKYGTLCLPGIGRLTIHHYAGKAPDISSIGKPVPPGGRAIGREVFKTEIRLTKSVSLRREIQLQDSDRRWREEKDAEGEWSGVPIRLRRKFSAGD